MSPRNITVKIEGEHINVVRANDSEIKKMLQELIRALIANMIKGVGWILC
jgi:ribosomal protein L6P/L9E